MNIAPLTAENRHILMAVCGFHLERIHRFGIKRQLPHEDEADLLRSREAVAQLTAVLDE